MASKTRLPSLQSLEAFLQIAKGVNIVEAAAELNLTASAVSRRLQNLEGALGVALFDRSGPRLRLTDAGAAYAQDVAPLLSALHKVSNGLASSQTSALELRVKSSPSFYANLIAPRLSEFMKEWPDAIVSLLTNDEQGAAADIVIRPSPHGESQPDETKLLDFHVTPMLRADIFESLKIRSKDEIARITLIENTKRPNDWRRWLAEADVIPDTPVRRVFVDSSFTAHTAMIGGSGAALLPSIYAGSSDNGYLVCPFEEISIYTGSSFISLKEDKPIAKSFHDWVLRFFSG